MPMRRPQPADTVDPVDRYIARLYRWALSVPISEYRAWALREWAQVVPHDFALWGTGLLSLWKFNTVTLTGGLAESFPRTLEETRAMNPILGPILQNLDTPIDMRSVMPDESFFQSEFYRRTFLPYGITRILSTAHLDQRSGLYSLVTLYRKDPDAVFSDADKERQKRIAYHLYNAASHAYFLHLARDHERPNGSAAAVVDRLGMFHEIQPRFLDMLDQHFPERASDTLPFELPAGDQPVLITPKLCVRAEPLGDVFLVYLWPAGPLDRLTQREREIVYAVAQGLSFKQAAKKIGVAPSTVANHLYRVYRKLGVYSRTELAALVYPDS